MGVLNPWTWMKKLWNALDDFYARQLFSEAPSSTLENAQRVTCQLCFSPIPLGVSTGAFPCCPIERMHFQCVKALYDREGEPDCPCCEETLDILRFVR